MRRLERWSFRLGHSTHLAVPEEELGNECFRAFGTFHGDGERPDREGHEIVTSTILGSTESNRLRITTASGTEYELGVVAPEYLTFLEEEGVVFNAQDPLASRRPPRRSLWQRIRGVVFRAEANP